ncbi:MAG: hypothetical protein ACTSSA_09085 [Candidatus Freyarchaeota archaeon]
MAAAKYQVYRYRWVAILAYCLVWFIAQPVWLAFAPISSTVRQAFFLTGVSETAITLLVISSLATEIIVSIPIGIIVDKKGWVFLHWDRSNPNHIRGDSQGLFTRHQLAPLLPVSTGIGDGLRLR